MVTWRVSQKVRHGIYCLLLMFTNHMPATSKKGHVKELSQNPRQKHVKQYHSKTFRALHVLSMSLCRWKRSRIAHAKKLKTAFKPLVKKYLSKTCHNNLDKIISKKHRQTFVIDIMLNTCHRKYSKTNCKIRTYKLVIEMSDTCHWFHTRRFCKGNGNNMLHNASRRNATWIVSKEYTQSGTCEKIRIKRTLQDAW